MVKKNFSGVQTDQEINISFRRDDVRTVWRKLSDSLDTPSGTLTFFFCLALLVSIPFCIIPGIGEIGVAISLSVLLFKYSYKYKKWAVPFRVPAYLSKNISRYYDESTGKEGQGLIYLGQEINTEKQVWATANDVKTHRLVLGTTGSGKTEEILGNIFNFLAMDSGTMLVDGKSDPKTLNSLLSVCRCLGREEDLLVLNYIKGGKDFNSELDGKRTHTYNPLGYGSGSAAMKAELMVSLLDSGGGGNSDMWQGRAINFLEAIFPPLNLLAERGYVLFNPKLLCDFFLLENIENLLWFGIFVDLNGNLVDLKKGDEEQQRLYKLLIEKYSGNLQMYVMNLPGYSMARPKKAHRPSSMDVQEWNKAGSSENNYEDSPQSSKNKQSAEQARAKVLEQHGYITMQLVRATGNLTFNYGHIYNDAIGEINYKDGLLNRRILLVMLPALENSKQSMEQLGKMAVSAIKGTLAVLLDTPIEGEKRKIIDGRPSNAEVPYSVICDEYGYYVVPGFAVAPAQARSYGVSITFGAQDYPSLTKGDKNEGEATWENTNLRICGRMTGGEESETFKKIAGAAGKAAVSTANAMDYNVGSSFDRFTLGKGSSLEMISRINSDDLNQQENGEFHLIVGKKGQKNSGAKVVRYLSFYTGNVPQPNVLKLVHYVQVKSFSDAEKEKVLLNADIAEKLSHYTPDEIQKIFFKLYKKHKEDTRKDSILDKFISRISTTWSMADEDICRWLDEYDRQAEIVVSDQEIKDKEQLQTDINQQNKKKRDNLDQLVSMTLKEVNSIGISFELLDVYSNLYSKVLINFYELSNIKNIEDYTKQAQMKIIQVQKEELLH